MMKRVCLALAGLLCLGQLVLAQPFPVSLLDQPTINSPWALLDSQDRFSFSTAFGSMRTTQEYLPVFDPTAPLSTTYAAGDNKSSVDRVVQLQSPSKVQFGGEIGFLYGKSTGGNGFGREDIAGYIIGTVGNDKFSITAGYYHQDTTFSGRGWHR